eukprot:c7588_g1_i1.p1 GENE.c7588_g1_i1~~c7588_g1_i1.p1  ORF type:complete len:1139 (-),score=279.91 c7588_g1_i1:9-3035(-)
MVMSNRCHLRNLPEAELVAAHEERCEAGGYFIINGNERCIRLLIVAKRNHILGLYRPSLVNRGNGYTPYMTSMRCVRIDQSAQSVSMHYLTGGLVTSRVMIRRREYFLPLPLLLRALYNASDRFIFESIVGNPNNATSTDSNHHIAFLAAQVEAMLADFNTQHPSLTSSDECLKFLGRNFRPVLLLGSHYSDKAVGTELLRRFFFVHLSDVREKYNVAIVMVKKLYSIAGQTCKCDNADSLDNQEILLPGHLYLTYLKEKLTESLEMISKLIVKDVRMKAGLDWTDAKYFRKVADKAAIDIGAKFEYMLATGNLQTSTGLDLMQTTGYSVTADKLNFFRYMSHFRSVHRGAFFAELRTTEVRKLLPESWGFLCPVHTPDGSPCGLLNHLTQRCKVMSIEEDSSQLPQILAEIGMIPSFPMITTGHDYLHVMLDGRVIGYVPEHQLFTIAEKLRSLKVTSHAGVPSTLEIAVVHHTNSKAYPGLFLSAGAARPIRQVRNLKANALETISPLEQLYLTIACLESDFKPGVTHHQELDLTHMLSVVASLTPFSDFNQSPRNMYQCQMCKQTMGTAVSTYPHRTDTKLYRIFTPQRPIVRTKMYNEMGMDEFAMGTNAVVAVIAYTGYDMEDAMIINKASMERGLMQGYVYTNKTIDLQDMTKRGEKVSFSFCGDRANANSTIESDGIIAEGTRIKQGDVLCSYKDDVTGQIHDVTHKSSEPAVVDQVRVLGAASGGVDNLPLQRVSIKLRYQRNPTIGDKFASRHGQKGVLAQLWPENSMPFTDSGIIPDILFNPHGFPSRMTIGMLIESIAAKSGALHGSFQEATPFTFSEDNRAIDHFASQLRSAGYSYYGTELLYSGVSGEPLECQIFTGIVYYQRLRHMVYDKYQVRAEGPINNLTHQPVKGRKAHGGIRLGEMERDALLAYGAAFIVHDRLMKCSDFDTACVCSKCGSLLSTACQPQTRAAHEAQQEVCRVCESGKYCRLVKMPYVFKYLCNELAAVNIRLQLKID